MKKYLAILAISLLVILFTNCENEYETTFGETESGFVQDSVYKTSSDGLLLVQVRTSNAITEMGAVICESKDNNPTDTIGIIEPFGSITLPLKEDTYWKVTTYGNVSLIEKLVIQWTPIK